MKENQILKIEGIKYSFDADGGILLNLKDVAVGLGFSFTQTQGGKEYIKIRWGNVVKLLEQFGFVQDDAQSSLSDTYISEPMFYLLAMKANSEEAKAFQIKAATEIFPSIRKNGGYISDEATPEQQKFLAENQIIDFIKQGNKKWGFRLQGLIESKDCNPIECMESYQYIYDKLGSKFRASFNDKFVYNFEKVAEDIRLKPGKKNGDLYCSIIKDRDTLLLAIEKNDHNFDNRSNGQNNRRSKCCKCK